jgi:hypothetical protein
MKRTIHMLVTCAVFCAVGSTTLAAVYRVELSPVASRALNLGTETYPGDHVNNLLSPRNENPQGGSPATGGILGGMSYDDVSNMLTMDFAYGSAFGFVDLASDWNGGLHIHGNGTDTAHYPAINTNAGVIYNLASLHTASGPRSGRVTGSVAITATHETWLLDNKLYINVHSVGIPGGEIRGQLVLVPEPAALCLAVLAGFGVLGLRRRRA